MDTVSSVELTTGWEINTIPQLIEVFDVVLCCRIYNFPSVEGNSTISAFSHPNDLKTVPKR